MRPVAWSGEATTAETDGPKIVTSNLESAQEHQAMASVAKEDIKEDDKDGEEPDAMVAEHKGPANAGETAEPTRGGEPGRSRSTYSNKTRVPPEESRRASTPRRRQTNSRGQRTKDRG